MNPGVFAAIYGMMKPGDRRYFREKYGDAKINPEYFDKYSVNPYGNPSSQKYYTSPPTVTATLIPDWYTIAVPPNIIERVNKYDAIQSGVSKY